MFFPPIPPQVSSASQFLTSSISFIHPSSLNFRSALLFCSLLFQVLLHGMRSGDRFCCTLVIFLPVEPYLSPILSLLFRSMTFFIPKSFGTLPVILQYSKILHIPLNYLLPQHSNIEIIYLISPHQTFIWSFAFE